MCEFLFACVRAPMCARVQDNLCLRMCRKRTKNKSKMNALLSVASVYMLPVHSQV